MEFPRCESHQGSDKPYPGITPPLIKQEDSNGKKYIRYCRRHTGGELCHAAAHHTYGRHTPIEERGLIGHLPHAVSGQDPIARFNHRITHNALAGLTLGVVLTETQKRNHREDADGQQQPKRFFGSHGNNLQNNQSYLSSRKSGSSGITRIGCCFSASRIFSGTYFLSTTRR